MSVKVDFVLKCIFPNNASANATAATLATVVETLAGVSKSAMGLTAIAGGLRPADVLEIEHDFSARCQANGQDCDRARSDPERAGGDA